MTVLASEKYAVGARIIPYVISAMVINGASVMFGAGLYIHKQSMSLMYMIITSAVLNVVLNLLLIPSYGFTGAALATLLSSVVFKVWSYAVTSKTLTIPFPWLTLTKFCLISLSMYFVIDRIQLNNIMLTLILQISTCVVLWYSRFTG